MKSFANDKNPWVIFQVKGKLIFQQKSVSMVLRWLKLLSFKKIIHAENISS